MFLILWLPSQALMEEQINFYFKPKGIDLNGVPVIREFPPREKVLEGWENSVFKKLPTG